MDFVVDDLSNWYVRTNRPRFWAPDRAADPACLATLHDALVTTARVLAPAAPFLARSEEHTSELQSRLHLVCRLLLEKKKKKNNIHKSACKRTCSYYI